MFQLLTLLVSLASVQSLPPVTANHNFVYDDNSAQRLSRYQVSLLGPRDVQRNLLAVAVDIEFDDKVRTVGEAIALLIEGSGYRLGEVSSEGLCRQAVLQLPLPRVHRKFERLTLRQALEVLVGPGHQPVFDETHRSVSIERVRPDLIIPSEGCGCD